MLVKKDEPKHGKKPNQKLKPYLVMQYLLRESDPDNTVSATTIIQYLHSIGIDAEKKSVYRDIEEINKAMLIAERSRDGDEYTLSEAEEELEEYGNDVRYIVYNPSKKGYYVRERRYEVDQIRLAAESIYASKFLTEKEAEDFVDMICSFVSEYQADDIKHDVLLTDRVKTNNKNTFRNVSTINAAMSTELDGEKHVPEKISFKYLKSTISDLKQQVERRKGAKYVVSPYALLLNEGNYYMLAFEDRTQKIKTYRVDRMRGVDLTGVPREGTEAFAAIDLKTYTRRVFSMFGGDKELVTIRFANDLLDSVIDRFGINDVKYTKVDGNSFSITEQIEISNQFFGWVCGFGEKAKITSPPKVEKRFKEYINSIRNLY